MPTTGRDEPIRVAVGIIFDDDGRVLLGRRPADKPQAGKWEFPGGKIEPGESPLEGLERELREELGIEVVHADRWRDFEHGYGPRPVVLHLMIVRRFEGEAAPREGQQLEWVAPENLFGFDLLQANREFADQIPDIRRWTSDKDVRNLPKPKTSSI